jgi:hypothetical protein
MATLINAVYALVISLRLVIGRSSAARTGKEVFGSAQVSNILGDFLKVWIILNIWRMISQPFCFKIGSRSASRRQDTPSRQRSYWPAL